MTILRRRRLLRAVRKACRASFYSFTASMACAAMLAGEPAHAATHSHGHHTLPTPLHTTTVADTGVRSTGKKRKASGKVQPGAAAPRSTHESGKKSGRHGKDRHPAPADHQIPMYRVERSAGHYGHELAQRHGQGSHGRTYAFATEPAPRVRPGRRGSAAQPAPQRQPTVARRAPELPQPHRPDPPAPMQMASRGKPSPTSDDLLHAAGTKDRSPSAPSRAIAEAYAEGVAHTEDDERVPRSAAATIEAEAADEATPANAGSSSVVITNKAPAQRSAEVLAAPIVRAAPNAHPASAPAGADQAPLVQGFGAEVAVPSTAPAGTRPGGTHRRNHPSSWSPEPIASLPVPLEEREAVTEAAVSPMVLPEIYNRNGRLLMPAPLKGSRDVLVHQNLMAANDGLERIQDDADLDRLRNAHLLVSFPVSASLRVSEDLPYNRRVARPWTVLFAADVGRAFFARFHQPLQVNSAVRTVNYQARLQWVNGNAAATSGEAASPHLTGQAIDLGKRGMSSAELAWMRSYLLPLMRSGKIDVEEEFQQACFHISVYRSYAAGRRPLHEMAQLQAASAQAHGADSTEDQQEKVQ